MSVSWAFWFQWCHQIRSFSFYIISPIYRNAYKHFLAIYKTEDG